MIKRRLGIILVTAALLPLTVAFARGGWWVHTVENLPEYLVAGEPLEMSISVRQHGISLGTLPASMGDRSAVEVQLTGPEGVAQRMSVTPSARPGYYTANVVAPEAGDWTMTVQSGGGYMRLELLPLRAIAAGSAPPVRLTAVERGRQLYVAKGCVTCHGTAAASATVVGARNMRVGSAPELIGRPFPSRDYVEEVMANPGRRAMPNLNLTRDEIGAIATFLHPGSETE